MPWESKTVEEARKEFVIATAKTTNFSSLCREFGITRRTGYKWLERAKETERLTDRSHARKNITNKTDGETEAQILSVRANNPEWGGKTIRQFLVNQGCEQLPCVKTVNNILKRNHCIDESESLKRHAFVRFQREHCNELWQADFKGDFPLLDGSRCFPLDILDDCSRYSIAIFPQNNTQGTRDCFEQTFRNFGMPKAVLTDNGAQFSGFRGGYTLFERWLMDLDIFPIHGRIMHPQTQGKIERFHRTMKNELLKYNDFADLEDATRQIQCWREKYNELRPHEALGMKCPAEVYVKSEREYPKRIHEYEYSGTYRMVKVNNWGYLRFDSIQVYLSETMGNTMLEIRPGEADYFDICYRNYRIAQVDAVEQRLLNRHISRLPC